MQANIATSYTVIIKVIAVWVAWRSLNTPHEFSALQRTLHWATDRRVCIEEKQWDNLDDSWRFYRRLFSPTVKVFTLYESMPSSEPLCHRYVDVLFVPPVTVTSAQNLTSRSGGGPRDRFQEAKKTCPRQPVQPFSKIDPEIQHWAQTPLQTFQVKSFCRRRVTKMERLLFKNVTDGFPASSALKREMVLIDEPIHFQLSLP